MSISAPRGMEDYSVSSRDYAVEIRFVFRINAEIKGASGRTLLSGWGNSAATKMTVFVSNPVSADAALKAVREMERELNSTLRLFSAIPDYMRPIITGVPLGFRITGTPAIVNRSRPRELGYIGDVLGDTKDALARKIAAFDALCASDS